MKCMRTVCEPKWCDGDFYQYFFWFTTTALRHLIKRPILASAFTLFIQFHFHRNSSVFEEFCKLKHPDMEWLICQSMLWWNLQWECCCNHFHPIFKCRIKPNFSWVQLLKENSEQFASNHRHSIKNTNKMLFDKRQKKKSSDESWQK